MLPFTLCHYCTLTIFLKSTVYKQCSRSEERTEVKLRMVCSFNTVVIHFKVTIKLLTGVDAMSTCCSIQYMSYTQR